MLSLTGAYPVGRLVTKPGHVLWAARKGHTWRLGWFLFVRPSFVNAKDTWKRRPLHFAAEKGDKGMAVLLLAKGADVNAKDVYRSTPLHCAAGAPATRARSP